MSREDVTERIAAMDEAMKAYREARPPRGFQLIFSGSCERREDLAQALEEAADRVRTCADDQHFSGVSSCGYWYEFDFNPWRRLQVEDRRYYLVDLEQEIF